MTIRIAVDAMGTDSHPEPELQAVASAIERWPDPITLVGPETLLEQKLAELGISEQRVRVLHAKQVLEMTDKPADSARGKPESSMAVGMELIKSGDADAFVTCGNTGGALANAIFRLGRIRGVKRPGLTAAFPVRGGQAIVLDIGANTDCKPEYLLQFAILGAVYAEKVLGIGSPKVGLLSNGEESGKGNELIKQAFPLLENSGLNFIGNVESKEVYGGEADVIVTDGFVGNVFLKTSEAVAAFLIEIIRDQIQSSPISSIGGLLAKPAFRRVGDILDPELYGAATLLGVNGLVFIGHGRFESNGVFNAIRVARQAAEIHLLDALQEAITSRLSSVPTELAE
ncbi:MAG: phosphate acyltransferase PlsX [Anaerolineales bacterium]